jgi:hypothetical protein
MTWRDRIIQLAVPWFIEGPGRRKGFVGVRADLSTTAQSVAERIGWAQPTPASVRKAQHIIGIERWGQRRLEVALGKPLQMDEHHGYKPQGQDLSPADLQKEFEDTRRRTLELVGQLEAKNYSEKIPHNGMGPLSVLGWLSYLNTHAEFESRRLKRR